MSVNICRSKSVLRQFLCQSNIPALLTVSHALSGQQQHGSAVKSPPRYWFSSLRMLNVLLKERSSVRRGGVARGDILSQTALPNRTPTPTPHHSLPLSEHRLTSGRPRSAFSHLSPGHGPLFLIAPSSVSSRPRTALITFSQPSGSEWPDGRVRSPTKQ